MDTVVLVAKLTVRRDEVEAFREFERIAARCLADHGARIERTVMYPHEAEPALFCELHLLRLPSHAALLAYRRDPRVAAAMPLRDRSVVHTEIVTGGDGPAYHDGVMPDVPLPPTTDGTAAGQTLTDSAEDRAKSGSPTPGPSAPGSPTSGTESIDCDTTDANGSDVETPEIRPFRLADEPDVIDLWTRCELVRPWNDPHKDIQRKLRVQSELFLVARLQDRLVGTVMAGYEGHRGWVNYLAVDPNCRRSGIGRRLMDEVESLLLARGCPKINLQMRAENRIAGRFYEQIGYKEDLTRSFGKRLIPDGPPTAPESRGASGRTDRVSDASDASDPPYASVVSDASVESDTPVAPTNATSGHETPSRDSVVQLKEISESNVRVVTSLAVAPGQDLFVADNATSLAEALFSDRAWYRAVYADETPVGFCMVYQDLEKPIYYLWRFMIDARYQRLGFGRKAMEQLIERGRSLSGVSEMLLSIVEGDGSPRRFYESLGFASTDTYEEGELVMKLAF